MKQQINLYQDQFREKKVLLSGKNIIVFMMILIVLDAMGILWVRYLNGVAAENKQVLATEDASVAAEMLAIKTRLDVRKVDASLQKSVAAAIRQYGIRQQLLEMVATSTQQGDAKFSEFLQGLARQSVRGLWFVHIDISEGGRQLLLEGSTLEAHLVPVVMQKLQHESAYSGREFRTVEFDRGDRSGGKIDFLFATRVVSKKDAAASLSQTSLLATN